MLGLASIDPLNPTAQVKTPVNRILVSVDLMAKLKEQAPEKAELFTKSEKSLG
jgi:hypothetical protein